MSQDTSTLAPDTPNLADTPPALLPLAAVHVLRTNAIWAAAGGAPETLAFDEAARRPITENEALAYALMPLLDVRLQLYQAFLELDRRVKRLASNDPVCLLLMTAPGVGAITALTFRAAVDDPRRFRRSRTVAAHFGLTPRRYQSGERDNPGHISKAGDPGVRAALYAAANSIMTRSGKWSSLKAWGMRLQRSKGRKRALVAVARKLAVILHVMWVDGTVFSFTEPEAVQ